jgi:predicted nuclease of predicted toxin-antitoxin system
MRILVDLNLSPEWVTVLADHHHEAVHWTQVGDPKASDKHIMAWARVNEYVIFTHDLDFGSILALTHEAGPSVIQVRGQDVMPSALQAILVSVLDQHESDLRLGAIIVVDGERRRVRILPMPP